MELVVKVWSCGCQQGTFCWAQHKTSDICLKNKNDQKNQHGQKATQQIQLQMDTMKSHPGEGGGGMGLQQE